MGQFQESNGSGGGIQDDDLPDDTVFRHNWPAEGLFEQGTLIFKDGYSFETAFARMRSAGWVVVVTNGWGRLQRALWGQVSRAEAPA